MTLLYGHRVLPGARGDFRLGPDVEQGVTTREFSEFVSRYRCRIANWDQAVATSKIGLSFDDGFKDFADHALPAIERIGKRVVLFVTTEFLGQVRTPYEYVVGELLASTPVPELPPIVRDDQHSVSNSGQIYKRVVSKLKLMEPQDRDHVVNELCTLNGRERASIPSPDMLTWDDLARLGRHPLVDIGAHTLSHPVLARSGWGRAWREMADSKRIIERRLSMRIAHFAYPYGANSFVVRKLARIAGFSMAFSTENGRGGKFAIPRQNLVAYTSAEAS